MKNSLPMMHATAIFILALAAVVIYGHILDHQFLTSWDDPVYVVRNEAVKGFSLPHLKAAFTNFFVGNYAPLQIVSYMLDYSVWGMQAKGFLLSNVIIHLLNAVLFYGLCCRLLGRQLPSLAAALIFLCHPVQVESVAWVSQRKNLLAMFFFLLAFFWYLRYRDAEPGTGRTDYSLSVAALTAALLTKSVAVIFPLVAALYDHCFMPHGRRRQIRDKLPYLLAAAAVALLALVSQREEAGGGLRPYHGGTPWATFLTMLPILVAYLRFLVWPVGLSAVYNPPIKTGIDGEVLMAGAVLALVAIGLWQLNRRWRPGLFWSGLFFIGLLPVSQIVPIITLMNDRYLYFPLLGGAGLVGAVLARIPEERWLSWRLPVAVGVALAVVGLAYGSCRRTEVWRDSRSLWEDAVVKAPTSFTAWHLLGDTYLAAGRTDQAVAAFTRAMGISPGNRLPLLRLSGIFVKTGELEKALPLVQQLLASHPNDGEGYEVLGNYYYVLNDLPKAEAAYARAVSLNGDLKSVYENLGNVYLGMGKPDRARDSYRHARVINRPTAQLEYSLACAEALLGNAGAALDALESALRLGFKNYDLVVNNPELSGVRELPRFKKLVMDHFGVEVRK